MMVQSNLTCCGEDFDGYRTNYTRGHGETCINIYKINTLRDWREEV